MSELCAFYIKGNRTSVWYFSGNQIEKLEPPSEPHYVIFNIPWVECSGENLETVKKNPMTIISTFTN